MTSYLLFHFWWVLSCNLHVVLPRPAHQARKKSARALGGCSPIVCPQDSRRSLCILIYTLKSHRLYALTILYALTTIHVHLPSSPPFIPLWLRFHSDCWWPWWSNIRLHELHGPERSGAHAEGHEHRQVQRDSALGALQGKGDLVIEILHISYVVVCL